jgi:hypothetical protein
MQQWPTVCNRLLNGNDKEIRLWNDLIKIELRTRAKVNEEELKSFYRILSSSSKYFMFVLINSIKRQYRKSNNVLKHFKILQLRTRSTKNFICLDSIELFFVRLSFEFNVLDYIWSDIDNNIPSDYVWTPSASRNPVGDARFSLKAVAISMDLQR